MKFKKGDRVKVTSITDDDGAGYLLGTVGEIVTVYDDGALYPYDLLADHNDEIYTLKEEELSICEIDPKG